MKETIKDLFGFMYSLSMGDYFFFIGTFLLIVLFIYIIYLLMVILIKIKLLKRI